MEHIRRVLPRVLQRNGLWSPDVTLDQVVDNDRGLRELLTHAWRLEQEWREDDLMRFLLKELGR